MPSNNPELRKATRKRFTLKQKSKGLCVKCQAPAVTKVLCELHRIQQNDYNKNRKRNQSNRVRASILTQLGKDPSRGV